MNSNRKNIYMCKFTVAIPIFKKKFLAKAINSVLSQTYQDFELILLNDCSPENIDIIVESYSDSRIRYYKNEKNVGMVDVVDNWNQCLSKAKGEYIICMGDDDELTRDCLDQYSKLIDLYPDVDVYHGQTIVIDEDSNPIFMSQTRPCWESVYELIYHRFRGREQYIGDFLYSVKALKQNGGFYKLPAAWGSDDITAVISATISGIANTHEVVFKYRSNSYSISSTGSISVKIDAVSKEELWYNNFLNTATSTSASDEIIIKLLSSNLKKTFQKKRLRLITDDLIGHPFNFFSWYKNSKKYGLSKQMIFYSLIMSIRDRKSIKYQKSLNNGKKR